MRVAFKFAFFLLAARSILANECNSVSDISTYVARLAMERIKLVHKTFLPPATDEGKWIEVQEAPEGSHAEVLFNGGLPLVADFVLTSDSGDWVLFATYYFRRDGSLAQQQERLNTFYGNAQVLRARVFGCGGKLLKSRSEHRDLKSKKLKKAEPEFIDERAPRIRNTGDLPFPW